MCAPGSRFGQQPGVYGHQGFLQLGHGALTFRDHSAEVSAVTQVLQLMHRPPNFGCSCIIPPAHNRAIVGHDSCSSLST